MPDPKNWYEAVYYLGAVIVFAIYLCLCIRASSKVPNTLADGIIAISFFPTIHFLLWIWQVVFIRFLGPALS